MGMIAIYNKMPVVTEMKNRFIYLYFNYEHYTVYPPKDFDYHRYLLIADHWTESRLFLDITGGDNPPVYLGYRMNLWASSFEKYTFQMAFDIMMHKKYLYSNSIGLSQLKTEALLGRLDENKENAIGTSQEWMASAMKLLEPYSLQTSWFSDEVRSCCFGEKVVAMVQIAEFRLLIVFAGDNETLLQKMKEDLGKEIADGIDSSKMNVASRR